MFSPYEELEYLADYLPDEGESVLVSRQAGELVCKPHPEDDLRDGIENAELYGFLVQANERLHAAGIVPVRWTAIILIWAGVLLHGVLKMSWEQWYLWPGLAIPVFLGMMHWIQLRQRTLFRQEIVPQLNRELSARKIRPYALIAGVRQHSELRILFDELVRWLPPRTSIPTDSNSR